MANPNPSIQHEEYKERAPQWKKCRDCVEGEDAVHKAGESYLPKLTGQTNDEYKAYVNRAGFYNATGRTIDGLVGFLFRKYPDVVTPTALYEIRDDITLSGVEIDVFAEQITREVLSVYRAGVLVEYPVVKEPPTSLAQAAAQNLRPYCTTYKAESIVNWRVARINNVMQPVLIVLKEEVTEYKDKFESEEIDQYRVLELAWNGERYVYSQQLYRENDKGELVEYGDAIIPLMNNQPLKYIPFVFFGANNNNHELDVPPLYDLVSLNLSHYRTSADLEHGAHFTGLPTAVIAGYQTDPAKNEKFSIGSATAWVFPMPDTKVHYLEFTGQGLGALERLKKEKEQAMAALGARMLAPEKQGVEAENTVRIRHSGEGAVLNSIANQISAGMTRVLTIIAEWMNVSGEIKYELNRDFIDISLGAQELTALVSAYQAGTISFETLFWNLQRGELVAPERTVEEERDLIDTQQPILSAV